MTGKLLLFFLTIYINPNQHIVYQWTTIDKGYRRFLLLQNGVGKYGPREKFDISYSHWCPYSISYSKTEVHSPRHPGTLSVYVQTDQKKRDIFPLFIIFYKSFKQHS